MDSEELFRSGCTNAVKVSLSDYVISRLDNQQESLSSTAGWYFYF